MESRRFASGAWLTMLLLFGPIMSACGPAAPTSPLGFSLDYSTGSIPPPYNHRYTIDVVFDEDGADVTYRLEYRYRDKLSEVELHELGYTSRDDIRWSGEFGHELAAEWQELARTSRLTGSAEPLPGADSMLVRVSDTDETFRAGVPLEREPWHEIARTVDRAARDALGHGRRAP